MGRSVETVSNSATVVYLHGLLDDADPGEPDLAEMDFEYECENISSMVERRYPSFDPVSGSDRRFLRGHRETIVLLENDHAYVTISEYCGITAVCLVPRPEIEDYNGDDPGYNLAYAWCERIVPGFRKLFEDAYPYSVCTRQATMSNGESVYRHIAS